MKQITITVPDNCELKKDGNTYTIVEKEKKVTYEDVARKLFCNNNGYFISSNSYITKYEFDTMCLSDANNCTSEKQAEKLLAINKLMNVAKYLNGDWQPDWKNSKEGKYCISFNGIDNKLFIDCVGVFQYSDIFFKYEKLAEQAIEILGEETIKLALCTDY